LAQQLNRLRIALFFFFTRKKKALAEKKKNSLLISGLSDLQSKSHSFIGL